MNHPKLLKVQKFLQQQKPVFNPKVYLIKVKEMVGSDYYVGWGGLHIHIKTPDQKHMLAVIAHSPTFWNISELSRL